MGKRRIAFLFPGQGSQEIGMGKDLFRSDEFFRSLVDEAGRMVGEDLERLCMRGPEKRLMLSRFVQPLLTSVSLGYLQLLVEKGVTADVVLGHSLGEITALGGAGVVSAPDAVAIATKRGMLMDEMAAKVNGGMMAVIMVPLPQVEELLEELNEPDRIVLANDNSPKQVVVTGDIEMLDAFAAKVKERNLGTCRKLVVAGPWHSHYMTQARVAFEEWAEPIHFGHPETPIILNATAKEETHPTTIKHLVTWQLTAPVFWRECMERLHALEIDTLVEIGPGRVLSGLARVNGFKGDVKVYNVNNMRGLETAAKELAG